MPTEVHLARYNKEMEELPITEEAWEECVLNVKGLRLIKNEKEELHLVEYYSVKNEDGIPVFWLNPNGSGSMRQRGFFNDEECYEIAIEIATFLKAIISGEEGHVLFEPNVGVIFDDCEPELQICLTLDDLHENKVYYDSDIKGTILWLMDRLKKVYSED